MTFGRLAAAILSVVFAAALLAFAAGGASLEGAVELLKGCVSADGVFLGVGVVLAIAALVLVVSHFRTLIQSSRSKVP